MAEIDPCCLSLAPLCPPLGTNLGAGPGCHLQTVPVLGQVRSLLGGDSRGFRPFWLVFRARAIANPRTSYCGCGMVAASSPASAFLSGLFVTRGFLLPSFSKQVLVLTENTRKQPKLLPPRFVSGFRASGGSTPTTVQLFYSYFRTSSSFAPNIIQATTNLRLIDRERKEDHGTFILSGKSVQAREIHGGCRR